MEKSGGYSKKNKNRTILGCGNPISGYYIQWNWNDWDISGPPCSL